jgi:hypothetical protein
MADMPGFHVLGVPGSLRAVVEPRACASGCAPPTPSCSRPRSTTGDTLPEPDVQLGFAAKRFDDGLELVDEEAAALVGAQLAALRRWAQALHDHA